MTDDLYSDAVIACADGVIMQIEVSAGSRTDRFPAGYNPWRHSIGVHVREDAVEGRANKAVIRIIADVCTVPKSAVTIVSGLTSSSKKIHIQGLYQDRLLAILYTVSSE